MKRTAWSINALSDELHISRQALTKALRDVEPAETRSLGNRTERRYRLADVVQALIEGKTGSGSPATEKARLDRLRADQVEFDLELKRGNYAPIEVLEYAIAEVSSQMVAIFEGLPKRIKNSAPFLRAREIKIIQNEITKARNLAADIQLKFD